MPTIDNLYALSALRHVSIDELVCGNRKAILPKPIVVESPREKTIHLLQKMHEQIAA